MKCAITSDFVTDSSDAGPCSKEGAKYLVKVGNLYFEMTLCTSHGLSMAGIRLVITNWMNPPKSPSSQEIAQ